MPWYSVFGIKDRSQPAAPADVPASLTAAAQPVKGPQSQFLQQTQTWQSEAWRYYDELGEFNTGVSWLASMMSRVRLRSAVIENDMDEPTVEDSGTAADVINALSGGVGGQSLLMRAMTIQTSVPGDCYLIGQVNEEDEIENWTVRSVDEVRVYNGKFQVVSERTPRIEWSDLPTDAVPVRIWKPHARYYHLADSVAHSALPIMRELELVNRHIVAQYLSRLASAGLLILPNEVEFPASEKYADAEDPFTAEFIDIAAEAIRTPGTASAVVPIPIKVPGEWIEKIRHIDFTLKIDEKIIGKRDSVINRLANKLDIPAEILTGRAQANHWTAWVLDEDALKTHIAPTAETICDSLTRGYLWPRLKASGMKPAEYTRHVVWYDLSELAQRPDRSANAQAAYDRLELSGEAFRREGGFDEADKPDQKELIELGLKAMLRNTPGAAPAALDALAGHKVLQEAASPDATGGEQPAGEAEVPSGRGKPPGPPDKPEEQAPPAKARAEQVAAQIRAAHAIRFGVGAPGDLLHPPVCQDHAYSCPYTHAAWAEAPVKLTTGTYECHLDTFGRLAVGQGVPYLDTSDWIRTPGVTSRKEPSRARV
jgi:hypothetical protein